MEEEDWDWEYPFYGGWELWTPEIYIAKIGKNELNVRGKFGTKHFWMGTSI